MNAPLKAVGGSGDLDVTMRQIGRDARRSARALALASTAQKNKALAAMAEALRGSEAAILKANAEDIAEAKSRGATPAFLDRLTLDTARVEAMADGLNVIRKL
jgi:glutamate-5-semialdehyde dehydrogenase